MFCVCVCVLEILVLNFFFWLRDYFERFLCWLDHWLSCMLNCIHICIFFFFWKTILKSCLDTSSIPCYLSSFLSFFLSQSWQLLNTWWIDRESSCLLDSFSIPDGSIEIFLAICWFVPRQLHLSTSIILDTYLATSQSIEIPLHALHFSLFCIFFLCVHSISFFFFL